MRWSPLLGGFLVLGTLPLVGDEPGQLKSAIGSPSPAALRPVVQTTETLRLTGRRASAFVTLETAGLSMTGRRASAFVTLETGGLSMTGRRASAFVTLETGGLSMTGLRGSAPSK